MTSLLSRANTLFAFCLDKRIFFLDFKPIRKESYLSIFKSRRFCLIFKNLCLIYTPAGFYKKFSMFFTHAKSCKLFIIIVGIKTINAYVNKFCNGIRKLRILEGFLKLYRSFLYFLCCLFVNFWFVFHSLTRDLKVCIKILNSLIKAGKSSNIKCENSWKLPKKVVFYFKNIFPKSIFQLKKPFFKIIFCSKALYCLFMRIINYIYKCLKSLLLILTLRIDGFQHLVLIQKLHNITSKRYSYLEYLMFTLKCQLRGVC